MKNALAELEAISRYAGNRVDYVQGGGGNTSVKLDDHRMLVKSSGSALGELCESSGFVMVDYQSIANEIANAESNELFNQFIRKSVHKDSPLSGRPSIEAGFHAVLGRCVLHTHSVYANVLNCMANQQQLVKELFPNAACVPYREPGLGITQAVARAIFAARDSNAAFLKNHGLIVWGDSSQHVIDIHESINETIISALGLARFQPAALSQPCEGVLFPDQAVYLSDNSENISPAAQQTISAADYIEKQIREAGKTPDYLPDAEVSRLLGMESEKYRLNRSRVK